MGSPALPAQDASPLIEPTQSSQRESSSIKIAAAQLSLIVNVRVASEDAGIAQKVCVREGDRVEVGDCLLRLASDLQTAEVRAAERELAIAAEEADNDVDLQFARVSGAVNEKVYQRSKQSARQFARSVSVTELERLRLELKRSELSGEQAVRNQRIGKLTVALRNEQLTAAKIRLAARDTCSPVAGVVAQKFQQPGQWVQAGEPVARIVSLDRLRIVCRCDMKRATPSQISGSATFRVADGDRERDADVVFVSPEIDPLNQDFEIWAEIDNVAGYLSPGVEGSLEIELQ